MRRKKMWKRKGKQLLRKHKIRREKELRERELQKRKMRRKIPVEEKKRSKQKKELGLRNKKRRITKKQLQMKKIVREKEEKQEQKKRLSVQKSIAYKEMGRDGICRVKDGIYSKTIRFNDINYQLAQNEDKNAIFEGWCDFLNYFDSSIHVQLSFINQKSNMKEYEKIIQIRPQYDAFDEIRMEYAQMLKNQLAKGNADYSGPGVEPSNYQPFKI